VFRLVAVGGLPVGRGLGVGLRSGFVLRCVRSGDFGHGWRGSCGSRRDGRRRLGRRGGRLLLLHGLFDCCRVLHGLVAQLLGLGPGSLLGLLLAGRLLALRGLLARARLRLALAVAARFVAARAATLALAAAALAAALAAAIIAVVAITAAVAARAAVAAFALRALAFGGRCACGRFGTAEQALEPADDAAGAGRNRRRRALRGGLLGCRLG